MRTRILTLRFSPQLGRFDDAALVSLQQKVVLEHVREHLVQVGGESMLVCVATWREQQQQQAAPPPPAAASPPVPANAPPAESRTNGAARPVGELRAELDDVQRAAFDRLRAWRSRTAHDEGAPPYVILTNRQLMALVRERPDSKAGIARIDGLGDKKVARHGDAILQVLHGPDRAEAPAATPDAEAVTP